LKSAAKKGHFFFGRAICFVQTPGKPFGKIIGNIPILKKQSDEVLERGFLSNIGVVVFLDVQYMFRFLAR